MSARPYLLQLGLCIRKKVVCQSTDMILCIRKRAVFSAKEPCICQFICISCSLAFVFAKMSCDRVQIWFSVSAKGPYVPEKSPMYVNLSISLTAEPLHSQECRVSEYRYDSLYPQKSRVFRKRTLYKRALCINSSTSLTPWPLHSRNGRVSEFKYDRLNPQKSRIFRKTTLYKRALCVNSTTSLTAWPLHSQNGRVSEYKHDRVNPQKSRMFRNRALQLSNHLYALQRDLCVRVNGTCQNTYMTVHICKRVLFPAKRALFSVNRAWFSAKQALHMSDYWYGVATISRLLKIIGLFCRICSHLQGPFAKETYHFKEPTNRSQPIWSYISVLSKPVLTLHSYEIAWRICRICIPAKEP